jgi:nucleotide-binding universal stress UspA family protein
MLWWPSGKIAGRYLSHYLPRQAHPIEPEPPLTADAIPVDVELAAAADWDRRVSTPREIVVGYDGSEHAREAVREACAVAGEGSHVTVVTAYRIPPEIRSYEFFEDLVGVFKEGAEEVSRSAREAVPDGPFEVDFVTAEGSPHEVLASCAAERGADLVVVGSHGVGRFRAALGGVTSKLLHDAPCPVLVVPGSVEPPRDAAAA